MRPATVIARPAGRRRCESPARSSLVFGLAPDAADQEDVVVGAQRQQQDRAGDRHEEGQLAVAEQVLEDVDREAERGGDDEEAARRPGRAARSSCRSRIQSRTSSTASAAGVDPLEGGGRLVGQFGGDRRVAGDPGLRAPPSPLRSSRAGRSASTLVRALRSRRRRRDRLRAPGRSGPRRRRARASPRRVKAPAGRRARARRRRRALVRAGPASAPAGRPSRLRSPALRGRAWSARGRRGRCRRWRRHSPGAVRSSPAARASPGCRAAVGAIRSRPTSRTSDAEESRSAPEA